MQYYNGQYKYEVIVHYYQGVYSGQIADYTKNKIKNMIQNGIVKRRESAPILFPGINLICFCTFFPETFSGICKKVKLNLYNLIAPIKF